MGKVALIGGGGVRSPLLMYGLNEARKAIGVDELVIYDTDLSRAVLMAKLGETIVAHNGGSLRIGIVRDLASAVDGATSLRKSSGLRSRRELSRSSLAGMSARSARGRWNYGLPRRGRSRRTGRRILRRRW